MAVIPDVCNTPAPPASPVPVPYPNIAQCNMAKSNTCSEKVFIVGANALNQKTEISSTSGDEAGVNNGAASGKVMGKAKFLNGSMAVKIEGSPAVLIGSGTGHNGDTPNTTGAASVPGQTKVMIMK